MIRSILALGLLLLAGCSGRNNPEAVADRAASQGRWDDAYTALVQASQSTDVMGKLALAALESGRLRAAAVAYIRLGEADSTRRGVAASGLARTADLAGRNQEALALTTAILGLRELAPEWPVGRVAMPLRISAGAPTDEVLTLVPAILASSPTHDTRQATLLELARASEARGGCQAAAPIYESLAQEPDDSVAAPARSAGARCRLADGLRMLAAGDTLAARRSLDATVAIDPAGAAGRRALVALGDVYLSEGDPFAAQVAWRTAAATAQPDTITDLALERLKRMPSSGGGTEPGRP